MRKFAGIITILLLITVLFSGHWVGSNVRGLPPLGIISTTIRGILIVAFVCIGIIVLIVLWTLELIFRR